MKKLIEIPFPRPTIKSYYWIALSVAIIITFILCVFQPFGTASFQHEYKFIILGGYGVVVGFAVAFYFSLSVLGFNKKAENNWTIINEVIDLFISVIFSIFACYIYASLVVWGNISWSALSSFILVASSIALFPVLIYLVYLYYKWKDSVRSAIDNNQSEDLTFQKEMILKGVNKSDVLKARIEDVLYAEAQDNYVILGVLNQNKLQRHIIRSTLSSIEKQLNPQVFMRTHRSFIVNTVGISQLIGNKSKAAIQLAKIDKHIPLSRTYYDKIKNVYSTIK